MRGMIDMNHPLIVKADLFAMVAHAAVGQRRRYTDEPYIVHPRRLALRIAALPGATVEMVVAALLHDTVEDTRKFVDGNGEVIVKTGEFCSRPAFKAGDIVLYMVPGITIELIRQEFGDLVALYVDGLTDVAMPWDGNRKVRMALNRDHTAAQPAEVQTIKLVDSEDNLDSIINDDPDFAQRYVPEKRDLLPHLKDGDPSVYASVEKIINDYRAARRAEREAEDAAKVA
jgi:(p)ppGpp synthase/HD superfamily hydrolase